MSDKVCRVCNTPGLSWAQVEGNWRLHTSEGTEHNCTGPKRLDRPTTDAAIDRTMNLVVKYLLEYANLLIDSKDDKKAKRVTRIARGISGSLTTEEYW